MRLLLVRHGESVGNITQVLQTRDEPLTERGRRQAGQIAAHLARRTDIQAIYASPLARAYETSQIIGAALGLMPQPEEDLAEISVGTAAGLTFKEWTERSPDEFERYRSQGTDYAFPGGESGRQLGARTAALIERLIAWHKQIDGTIVVVSHGGALAWILAYLQDEATDTWPRHHFDNCSITELVIDPQTGRVSEMVCQNEIGHLALSADEEVATGTL